MIVALIVARGENGAIGLRGDLPWHISSDLKRFKRLTMDHHLILGRKTYESLKGPLPGRVIIVLTRDPDYHPPGVQVAGSLEAGLALAADQGESEVFVGGGAEVYAKALPRADRIYLTVVHASPEADAYFPPFDEQDWQVLGSESHPADPTRGDQHAFTFKLLERHRNPG